MGLMFARLVCSVLLLAVSAPPPAGTAGAQTPSPAAAPAVPADSDYVIGAHDVLNVTVFGEPDLSGPFRVDGDGTITYPLVGRVPASGTTARSLEDRLRTLLTNGYLKDPQVRVEVEQYRSQSVFVIGEVREPGRYPLTGDMTLIEALAAAGSMSGTAGSEVLVVHSTHKTPPAGPVVPGADQTAEVTHVNITDLQTGRMSSNVMLHDGDTIFVPKAQTFYITGQVKNPGAYVLQPDMTVLQAISLAGGLTDRGSNRRIKVVRFVNGRKHEIEMDLTDRVQAGDTVVVPQRFF
ncbi:MAG TPA: polysaccharide biosynthesis/export family protein [Vicinamibacterales bacterium]|jgi:polysaccharide export outer membrane protein